MATHIVNICPTGQDREIEATGQIVPFGESVEVDDAALAESLLEQVEVWARPTSNAAKAAKKAASATPPPSTTASTSEEEGQ
jgi:hypothetical protein